VNALSATSPIFIHTDVSKIHRSTLRRIDTKQGLLPGLHKFLKESFSEQELWFPAFNYDFAKTLVFDPINDPIQVGALNESLRNTGEYARSLIPIFSILRPTPEEGIRVRPKVNPFDLQGEFAELRNRNGAITFFGASLESLTFIHYIEKLAGIPYRYEKLFKGNLLLDNQITQISLVYLVRPLSMHLEYNWGKISELLSDAKISFKNHGFGDYEIYNANDLTEFMLTKYAEDIFWTLTDGSKIESQKKLEELGREFRIEDFERDTADA
jgi:aminoglycoside 3-N-acetyltransferase